MTLGRRPRILLGALGVSLVLLGAASWVIPAAVSGGSLVNRTVEIRKGPVKTTERTIGWGSVQSVEVAIVLLGTGFGLLLLGILPAGSVVSLRAGVAEVRFSEEVVADIVGAAAEAVPSNKLQQVVGETLSQLGSRRLTALEPSRDEIDETIARVLEQEDQI